MIERALRLLAGVVSDKVFLLDLAGTVRYATDSARALLSTDPRAEGAGSHTIADFFDFPGGSAAAAVQSWASSDALSFVPLSRPEGDGGGIERFRGEGSRVHDDDGTPWVLLRVLPQSDATRKFTSLTRQIIGLEEEVHRRLLAERHLRESMERLETILLTSPLPAVAADGNGTILLFSNSAAEVFGVSASTARGSLLDDLLPEWRALAAKSGESTDAGHSALDATAIRAGGATFPVEVSVSQAPIQDELVHTFLINDLTERLQREAAARRAHRLEVVGRLTGGVAHDFNNLLTVLIGNLDLLGRSPNLHADDMGLISDAHRAAERGSALTRQLLAFSRQQALQPQVLDLSDTVASMAALLRRTLGEDIEIKVSAPDSMWVCEVDPGQMEATILNLALNSRHAMPGGGTLSITLENTVIGSEGMHRSAPIEAGDYVALTVTDDGVGMSAEVRERIFEPFFTTREVGSGTGLGLSMVYGFVKQSSGFVFVLSEPGEGAAIQILFPRSGQDQTADLPAPDAAHSGRGRRALLVEDDPAVLRVVQKYLEQLGYESLVASRGDDAVTILAAQGDQLDLVISDVVLPGPVSGVDIARKVRARRSDLPILLISGYAATVLEREERMPDGVEVLPKPFTQADLASRLAALEASPSGT